MFEKVNDECERRRSRKLKNLLKDRNYEKEDKNSFMHYFLWFYESISGERFNDDYFLWKQGG